MHVNNFRVRSVRFPSFVLAVLRTFVNFSFRVIHVISISGSLCDFNHLARFFCAGARCSQVVQYSWQRVIGTRVFSGRRSRVIFEYCSKLI